jgi:hypothetical protein
MRKLNKALLSLFFALSSVCVFQVYGASPNIDPNTVTMSGSLLCETAVVPNIYMGEPGNTHYEYIFYAVKGSGYVDRTMSALLDRYYPNPANGVTVDQAALFLDKMTEQLKFYITNPISDSLPGINAGHANIKWGILMVELTGTVEFREGKRYFTVTSGRRISDYGIYPDALKAPDVPISRNTDKADFKLRLNESLSVVCKYIPAGSFFMGSPFYQAPRYQDEYPHKVTLTKSYYMTEVPITQAMWKAVMDTLPVPPPVEWGRSFADRVAEGDNKPMEFANWNDIHEFCRRLSEFNGVKVRLPTAAEWEYAARAGSSSPPLAVKYTPTNVGFNGATGVKSGDVRLGAPNPYGLYDMLSNGWHTVYDYKHDNTRHEETDPTGITKPWQSNTFKSWMHQSKGGFHYTINQPNMHGANGEDGGLWEQGSVIFRVIIEDADKINPAK